MIYLEKKSTQKHTISYHSIFGLMDTHREEWYAAIVGFCIAPYKDTKLRSTERKPISGGHRTYLIKLRKSA
jgi:hypothetical protein